ncbi:SHOCT domain-containing protein [Gordonia rubripertincta]|nr:SHOCT domain-containing protein [Gordonia rubripertincta]
MHSVGSGKGWVFSEITINTPTNNIHFGEPRPSWLVEEFVNLVLESRAAANATQKEAVVAGGEQVLVQLRQLAELHVAGVLTDEEFAQKKTELLKRI